LSGGIRLKVFDRLNEITDGLEKTFNVACRLQIHKGVPTLENDIEVADFLYQISRDILGSENVAYLPPIMGSEDFSFFTEARPCAIMRLGCSNSQKGLTGKLHSPRFDIDEQVLEIGVAIFSEAVVRYLK
jgi:amidohydrolase